MFRVITMTLRPTICRPSTPLLVTLRYFHSFQLSFRQFYTNFRGIFRWVSRYFVPTMRSSSSCLITPSLCSCFHWIFGLVWCSTAYYPITNIHKQVSFPSKFWPDKILQAILIFIQNFFQPMIIKDRIFCLIPGVWKEGMKFGSGKSNHISSIRSSQESVSFQRFLNHVNTWVNVPNLSR